MEVVGRKIFEKSPPPRLLSKTFVIEIGFSGQIYLTFLV